MKIVINDCYGGFGLSIKAKERISELRGEKLYTYNQTKYKFQHGIDEWTRVDNNCESWFTISFTKDFGEKVDGDTLDFDYSFNNPERNDLYLIQVVEELGEESYGKCSELKIVEIPDDVEWEIKEYDGSEWIAEKHKIWS